MLKENEGTLFFESFFGSPLQLVIIEKGLQQIFFHSFHSMAVL